MTEKGNVSNNVALLKGRQKCFLHEDINVSILYEAMDMMCISLQRSAAKDLIQISKGLKVTKENTIIVIIVSNILMQNDDFSF